MLMGAWWVPQTNDHLNVCRGICRKYIDDAGMSVQLLEKV
jgi:hypothetical protein